MLSATTPRTRLTRRAVTAALALAGLAAVPSAAQAQELVHRFINPSFGGNPFYSEHLLSIANIHRPEQPEEPATPAPTEEELLVRQLQSSLNAQVSSQILDRIRNARPGDTGEFTLGIQRISFTRSQTETRITFLNTETGESRLIILPVNPSSGFSGSASGLAAAGPAAPTRSAEQALGSLGASPTGPLSGGQSSALFGTPPF